MFNASCKNSLNVLIVSIFSDDYVFRKNMVSYVPLLRNVYRITSLQCSLSAKLRQWVFEALIDAIFRHVFKCIYK